MVYMIGAATFAGLYSMVSQECFARYGQRVWIAFGLVIFTATLLMAAVLHPPCSAFGPVTGALVSWIAAALVAGLPLLAAAWATWRQTRHHPRPSFGGWLRGVGAFVYGAVVGVPAAMAFTIAVLSSQGCWP